MSDRTDDTQAPEIDRPATAVAAELATTVMLHRGSRDSAAWWHTATVHHLGTVAPAAASADVLAALTDALSPLARLGASAVSVRCPVWGDPEAHEAMSVFLHRADQLGVRALLAVTASHLDEEPTLRHWISRGAAGIDLGPATEGAGAVSHEEYRRLHALLAEESDAETIIVTSVPGDAEEKLATLLYEDWPHHVIDTSLTRVSSAPHLREALSRAVAARDAAGAPPAWLLPAATEAGGTSRARALALVGAALPGSLHLGQGIDIAASPPSSAADDPAGAISHWATHARAHRGVRGSTFEMLRTAVRLRQEFRLGISPMAWVQGRGAPDDSDVLAFLTGEVLVLANLGTATHPLPAEIEVLVSSSPDSPGWLPPGSAVWLWLAPTAPPPDPRVRRS